MAFDRKPLTRASPYRDTPWRDRAACLGLDPETFFPEPELVPNGHGKTRVNYEPALAICRTCEVTVECYIEGVELSRGEGVWGGMTPEERRAAQR